MKNLFSIIFALVVLGQTIHAQQAVGLGISTSDHTYVWYDNGTASSGSTSKLNIHRSSFKYTLPPGKSFKDIVGMGIAQNNHVYAWYKDGTVSSGSSRDLDIHRKPYKYSLPSGKTPNDIVGIAISANNNVLAWYKDGTKSKGSSRDLDLHEKPTKYVLPTGKSPSHIIGTGISKENNVYVWYKDGYASSGTSRNLESKRPLYPTNLTNNNSPVSRGDGEGHFGGISIRGGTSAQQKLAFEGFDYMRKAVSGSSFKSCLEKAYLVEHADRNANYIASKFKSNKIVTIIIKELKPNRNAEAKVHIDSRGMRMDIGFINRNRSNISRIASVIGHELAHNFGFKHDKNDNGTRYYKNTVPEQVEACICFNKPNPFPGPGKPYIDPSNVIDMGIDGNRNSVFTFYKDQTVSAGSSSKLHSKRIPQKFSLPSGKTVDDIVGIGIDGSNDYVFVWYRDRTVSAGSPIDLDKYRKLAGYSLPPGKQPSDIVGMAIDGEQDYVFAWYKDGTVSRGSSKDLDSSRAPYKYTLPPGKRPADIIGMAVDGYTDAVFTYYKDGTVSRGSTRDLDASNSKLASTKIGTGR